MIWELFVVFFQIGLVSFGGGYAVIPMIQYEAEARYWMSTSEFHEAVALAGMAPGPIATNAATLIGYKSAGFLGAVISTLGIVLPSLTVVVVLSALFFPLQHNKWVKSLFYGLRPVIAGVIAYAAIHFGNFDRVESISWITLFTLLILAGSLVLLVKYKMHPFMVIMAAGAAGIILF